MVFSQHRVLSSKTVRLCALCNAPCMKHIIGRCRRCVQWRRILNSVKSKTPFGHGQMKLPKTSLQEIKFNPNCLGRARSNTDTGFGYENTEPGCIFTVLHVPFAICQLRSSDAKLAKLFERFCAAGKKSIWILVSFGEYLKTHLKDHT